MLSFSPSFIDTNVSPPCAWYFKGQSQLLFTEHLPCARCYTEPFTYIITYITTAEASL